MTTLTSNRLMTRDEFRNLVFARDNHKCVVCGQPGQDAHHIMERRLFSSDDEEFGYFINNGATLCGDCHIKAEQTLISPKQLYEILGVERVLPQQLYRDYEYTKWGDIENANGTRTRGPLFLDESVQKILKAGNVLDKYLPYVKYPRTYHLPYSPGVNKDDRVMDSYSFRDCIVVATLKMDGENTTGYSDGYIHARSVDGEHHESQSWVRNFLTQRLYDLPNGWRICGENLYAKHSIHYTDLKSYFCLFSIWNEKDEILSWPETLEWSKLLGLETVPVIWQGEWDATDNGRLIEKLFLKNYPNHEGYVVRNFSNFRNYQFKHYCAKYVRAGHVQTSHHWKRQQIVKNLLTT